MSPSTATTATLFFSLFLLFFFSLTLSNVNRNNTTTAAAAVAVAEMVPLIEAGKGEIILNDTRRKLGSFQICALCTCCGGAKGYCIPSPCCYAINCNIPNRPFGFCSFTPKSCNCFGCHI